MPEFLKNAGKVASLKVTGVDLSVYTDWCFKSKIGGLGYTWGFRREGFAHWKLDNVWVRARLIELSDVCWVVALYFSLNLLLSP